MPAALRGPGHFPRGNHCLRFFTHFSKAINKDTYSHASMYECIYVIIIHTHTHIYTATYYTTFPDVFSLNNIS